MGITGIYKEIGPGQRIALSKLAVKKFEQTCRPLRIAIDVSIWLFQIQAGKGGANPAVRTFYYRLLRMIANSIHPVFVFDGPDKPPFKRGKKTGPNVSSMPSYQAKQLIRQFGFPMHFAPGEAEAECALLQREGIVDAVLSEDVDTLMFGSGLCIRNWSPEPGTSGKTPTHVNVYDAVETKRNAGLDREGMILVALMSGGDYVPEGIPGCGIKTACAAAKAGFGKDLCKINPTDTAAMRAWKDRLQHEIKTNASKFFKTKRPSLIIPDDFPRLDILRYYTHPVVSNTASLDKLRRSMKWDQEIDFPGLREFTHDAFEWLRLEGAKHFVRSLAPAILIRALRTRGATAQFTDDPDALKEDEALWVKGIHGKRQHAITDHCTELRVSYTPIELVKIDLSKEDPDEIASTQGLAAEGSAEIDPDMADMEDDNEDGLRTRGPTKFDPTKPARTWVLETFVKTGVPVTVEDWEAGTRKPKRAATAKETTKAAPKPRAKRTKTTNDVPQASITQFAKVTKPGAGLSQRISRSQKPVDRPPSRLPSVPPTMEVIDLLSPVKPRSAAPSQPPREKSTRERSLSPVMELPSSVTKRRRRVPMQRAQTLPASPTAPLLARPSTPPLAESDIIQTLDLSMISPGATSPSVGPSKKARTTRNPPASRPTRREKSVTASPSKTKQTTLESWITPTKSRKDARLPKDTMPPPAPRFDSAIDTLDLTMSPEKEKPVPKKRTTTTRPSTNLRRTNPPTASPRPPLQSIDSNTSITSSSTLTSDASTIRPGSKPARQPSSTNVSFDNVDCLDLSGLSSPPPRAASKPTRQPSSTNVSFENVDCLDLSGFSSPPPQAASSSFRPAPKTTPPPPAPDLDLQVRRSPRNHKTTPPTAAWKQHQKRKGIIRLRDSLPGGFEIKDTESPEKKGAVGALKGKERRTWRLSQVEVLDLT